MEFSDTIYEEIEKLSGTGYTVPKMAMYLVVDPVLLQNEYDNKNSKFRYHCDRGILMCEAQRDIALQEAVKVGNMTALQILTTRMEKRNISNFKDELINGYL